MIGGSARNFVRAGIVGATIGGGGSGNYLGFGFTNRVESDFGTVSGGRNNAIQTNTIDAVIGGGRGNTIQAGAFRSTIGGGSNHTIETEASSSTIAGGAGNEIGAGSFNGTVGGGLGHTIGSNAPQATIAGGAQNTIQSSNVSATIGGGNVNTIEFGAGGATIGGGGFNRILSGGEFATIPGGAQNTATNYAFAAGVRAKAIHTGAFVWADSQGVDFASTANNQFLIRASGGVGIGETAPEAPLHLSEGSAGTMIANDNSVAVFEKSGSAYLSILTPTANESGILFASPTNSADGAIVYNSGTPRGLDFRTAGNLVRMVLTSSGDLGIGILSPTNKLHVAGGITCTALVETSDRNAKQNFLPLDPRAVLAKVTALPITTWHFKELPDGRHMGPMAQDFHAAFGLGASDQTITSMDRDGVALAAIQGLNQKLEQKETEITELRRAVIELKQLVHAMNHKLNGGVK